eukprot:TRINITY_DN8070_c0_g1_i12.p1 TRINITY_DN8070_c0_g1~~TRINITY_DN8070_c0_g1_i12.p1  ORF type:complete len:1016 (+),score=253.99 TRINITY_DN8070_c0_g1_i12:447-3494(+)
MDLLVTFGKEGWPLCSADGLYWSEDVWWARISIGLIGGTYVVLMVLSFPIALKVIQRQLKQIFPNASEALLLTTSTATWLVVGLPTLVLSDIALMITYPCSSPPYSSLANIARLRVVTETLLESPGQSLLQGRILYVKVVTNRSKLSLMKVSTLAYSLASSVFAMGLTLKGIYDMKIAQDISFVQCLWDLLSVGLELNAPLLHLLKTKPEVDYSNEGPLSDEHLVQICRVLPTCSNLKQITFGSENHLSSSGWSQLAGALPQLLQESPEMTGYMGTEEDEGCVKFGGEEIEVEHAGASKVAWALSLGPSFGRQRIALKRLVPEPQTPQLEPQTPQGERKQPRHIQSLDLEDLNDVSALQHALNLLEQFQVEFQQLRLKSVLSKEVFLVLAPLLAKEPSIVNSHLSITNMTFTPSDDEVAAQAFAHAVPQLQAAAPGDQSMLLQVADGGKFDLLRSENIRVTKPTAVELRWLLSAPAAKVLELHDPELSMNQIKSCVAEAKELCKQREEYKLLVHFHGDEKAQDVTSDNASFEFMAMSQSRCRWIRAAEAGSLKLVGMKDTDVKLLAKGSKSLPSIGSAVLKSCRRMTTSGFKTLASLCPNMTSVNITGCHELMDDGVLPTKLLPTKLQSAELNFSKCRVLKRLPLDLQQYQALHSFILNCGWCFAVKEVERLVLPAKVKTAELIFGDSSDPDSGCKALQRLPMNLQQCQELQSFKLICSFCNALKTVESMVLPEQVEVVELSFASCKSLERFPEVGLGNCKHIKSIKVDCSGTNWTSKDLESLVLPDSLVLPAKLQTAELNFQGCTALERLPLEMQQCQELHSFKLNCSGCEVLKEVKSFALSSKLQTADVNFQGCTALERLPLEMQQCQELHSFKLNCSGCEVLKEVKSFALSSKLQTADVNFQGCTALERLPLEMQQCQELHSFKLNCSGCEVLKEVKSFVLPVQVEEVELSFASCKSLERFPEVGLGNCKHIKSIKVDCSGASCTGGGSGAELRQLQVHQLDLEGFGEPSAS